METKTVINIVKEWLQSNGYDGLCGDECGCELSDLAPCGDIGGTCQAAYKHVNVKIYGEFYKVFMTNSKERPEEDVE